MDEKCLDCWTIQQQKYKKLEQQRKDDIHFLVMVLGLILPATYREILHDLGADEYVEMYALQDLINREKYK